MSQNENKQESFGGFIRRKRQERGLPQESLADAAGVTKSYISKLETGVVKSPSTSVLVGLARQLEFTLEEIMSFWMDPREVKLWQEIEALENQLEKLGIINIDGHGLGEGRYMLRPTLSNLDFYKRYLQYQLERVEKEK